MMPHDPLLPPKTFCPENGTSFRVASEGVITPDGKYERATVSKHRRSRYRVRPMSREHRDMRLQPIRNAKVPLSSAGRQSKQPPPGRCCLRVDDSTRRGIAGRAETGLAALLSDRTPAHMVLAPRRPEDTTGNAGKQCLRTSKLRMASPLLRDGKPQSWSGWTKTAHQKETGGRSRR
jgi:hypothetical protein